MYTGKLFLCLDTLTKPEKNEFRDFVRSPFFNKNEDTMRFLDIIFGDEEKKLSKEQVFQLLFRGSKYDARKITDQVYYLTRLAEQFLSYRKFSADPTLQNINLLSECLDRSIEKMALAVAGNIESQFKETEFLDYNYYYREYMYQAELDRYYVGRENIKRDESLQKKADSLDLFFIYARLRDCCEMLNRTQIIQSSYRMPMLDYVKAYVEEYLSDFEKYPAIGIYYHILLMLQNPETDEHFNKLMNLLDSKYSFFPDIELRDMYN